MSPPSPPRRRRRRPSILMSVGDLQQLITECDTALAQDPCCTHTRAVRGHACMKAKMWEQAARDFEEVLHKYPDDESARFSRGMALFKTGRVEDALQEFSRVLELNPAHVMARYARAGCYNSEGEYHQAIQEYWLALRHDEETTRAPLRLDRLISSNNSRDKGTSEAGEPVVVDGGATANSSLVVIETKVKTQMNASPSNNSSAGSVEAKQNMPQRGARKVVQVRVNLSQFATATISHTPSAGLFDPLRVHQPKEVAPLVISNETIPTGKPVQQVLQASIPQRTPPSVAPRVVRRVTVVL